MKKGIYLSLLTIVFFILNMASGSSQFVGINFATPVFELDIRTNDANDANDGSIINLGNLNNDHFLRFFSGRQLDFPFPSIYWKDGDSLSFGTDFNEYTEVMKLRTDGSLFLNSQNGIVLNQGNLPLITRGWDPFLSGVYSGLGRWGMFMEPFYLTLGMPQIPGRGFQFVTYNDNSSINKTLMTINETGNVGIGTINPTAKLEVVENVSGNNTANFQYNFATGLGKAINVVNRGLGNAGVFSIDNIASTGYGLVVSSNSSNGVVARIEATNTLNTQAAMIILNMGNGEGIDASTTGSGNAVEGASFGSGGSGGKFSISNSSSNGVALLATTTGIGNVIRADHFGTQGNLARLVKTNNTNPDPILYISESGGSGHGIFLDFNKTSITGDGIHLEHIGTGDGIEIDKSRGTAARFNITGIPSNANSALVAKITTGNGVVASIDHNDVNSNNHALTVSHSGNGNAILAQVPGASTAYAVYAIGDAYKTTGGNLWAIPSDMRLKKNIGPFQVGLNTILKINPVTFRYNGLFNTTEGEKSVGIIAQELVGVAPYMITNQPIKDESSGVTENILTYDGTALSFILVNAIKELNNKISSQEEIISTMEIAIKELQKEIIQLKND